MSKIWKNEGCKYLLCQFIQVFRYDQDKGNPVIKIVLHLQLHFSLESELLLENCIFYLLTIDSLESLGRH